MPVKATATPLPLRLQPAYKLQVDFREELGIKKSSAQITDLYTKEELVGKQVPAVVNFPRDKSDPLGLNV